MNVSNFLSTFGPVMFTFNDDIKHHVCSIIFDVVIKFKNRKYNTSLLLVNIKLLKSNSSCIIMKAYKRCCIVIFNKTDYISKILDYLRDDSTSLPVENDLNNSMQSRMSKLLSKLFNSLDIKFELAKC